MRTLTEFIDDTLRTAAVASVTTPVAAAVCGKAEHTSAIGPVNAVSHILWGDQAAAHDELSGKYTLAGLALNSAAMVSWAVVYEAMYGAEAKAGDVAGALFGGVAVAAVAYVTDYYVVPDRLTPGFEKRISGQSLFAIYATLALSLGIGGLLKKR